MIRDCGQYLSQSPDGDFFDPEQMQLLDENETPLVTVP